MARGPSLTTRTGRASAGSSRFASQVDAWVQDTEKRMNAVFRLSTQKVIEIMQANVPYRDGFLRASLVVLVNKDPPKADKTSDNGMGEYTQAYMQMALSNAKAGDRIVSAYTMVYARRLEYGFTGTDSLGRSYSQPPRAWVRLAAQQWPQAVDAATKEAKAR